MYAGMDGWMDVCMYVYMYPLAVFVYNNDNDNVCTIYVSLISSLPTDHVHIYVYA